MMLYNMLGRGPAPGSPAQPTIANRYHQETAGGLGGRPSTAETAAKGAPFGLFQLASRVQRSLARTVLVSSVSSLTSNALENSR